MTVVFMISLQKYIQSSNFRNFFTVFRADVAFFRFLNIFDSPDLSDAKAGTAKVTYILFQGGYLAIAPEVQESIRHKRRLNPLHCQFILGMM